ncbi:hypothetical protein F2Q69_00002609 [Brassica cretica]|uniref:Uncharacterized protein n=1 Tax=Brassica cretica TaxID=69181 RepID=A0A8S9P9P2_BRACR|nr:hypothetical protein F2Q69_00002609 [Brassica cretica]
MDDIYSAVAAFPHPSSSIPSSPTSGQMGQEQRHQILDCNQGRDLIWTIKAISSQAQASKLTSHGSSSSKLSKFDVDKKAICSVVNSNVLSFILKSFAIWSFCRPIIFKPRNGEPRSQRAVGNDEQASYLDLACSASKNDGNDQTFWDTIIWLSLEKTLASVISHGTLNNALEKTLVSAVCQYFVELTKAMNEDSCLCGLSILCGVDKSDERTATLQQPLPVIGQAQAHLRSPEQLRRLRRLELSETNHARISAET